MISLLDRFKELFPLCGVDARRGSHLEEALEITLPENFKKIAAFCNGNCVGLFSFEACCEADALSVLSETLRLRKAINLPASYVVLAEPPASLVVMDGSGRVIWLYSVEAPLLAQGISSLTEPDIWESFSDYFGYLLDEEFEERSQSQG